MDDTLNVQLQRQLDEFPGLVRKIKRNKIQIIGINDESILDTMVVEFK